jgi:stage V sporulation protein R
MFEVRRTNRNRFFVEHSLTEKLVDELELYLLEGRQEAYGIKYVITDRDWQRIRQLLVTHLSTFDIPLILVEDGDYKGKRELYLKHGYERIELDQEYREKTMDQIFYLWYRPVHLETVVNGKEAVFSADEGNQPRNERKKPHRF